MMKKLTLFSVVMLLFGITSFGQSVSPCGFDIVHRAKMLTDPTYENAVRDFDNYCVRKSSIMSTAMLTYTASGYVYEIPMVIHVLHTGGAIGTKYNPDSATIAAMVAYLNKAYAAVSPFRDTTTSLTTGGGARIPLKFILAKRSPSGAATNGIIRLDASSIPNYTTYGANASTTTGVDPSDIMAFSRWNPSDYYNVYSVNKIDGNDLYTTGGIAGFAYFPGTPTYDGMIVAASQVKTGSTTVAHEFGHGFNLYHVFEGDGGTATCPTNANCLTDGDRVCDTEPEWGSNHYSPWCPPTDVNPCTGGSYKGVDHNIMDYTQCPPDRFTAGQRTRILATLDSIRAGFKTSYGLVAPTGTVTTTCVPTSTSGATAAVGPYIVSFGSMNVWTGSLGMETFEYVDHSYTQQNYVSKGGSYPIIVETKTNKQNVKVYIDYNNDGDFADAGENVFNHTGTASNEKHTGTIIIPTTGVTTCTWLRMRVVAAFSTAAITDYACGPYANNAQAEDYAVYVKDLAGADTVSIGLTSGSIPACSGSTLVFKATPKTGTPTYRWYLNGVATAITTSTYTSSTLNNNDVLTVKTYFTGPCGADSGISNPWIVKISSSALASAKISLITGVNPGCPGMSYVFKMTVSGGGSAPVFAWKKNGTAVGFNVDTFAVSSLVAGDKIWCRVTPNSTCSTTPVNSDTITISFGSITPTSTISLISGTIPSCDSTSLTFQEKDANGGSNPKIKWYVNGAAIADTTIYFTNSYLKNNDTVQCRIISNHPCIVPGVGDTAWSNKIIVKRDPRTVPTLAVNITRGTNPGCLGELLEFTATASDGGGSPLVVWYINRAISAYGTVYGSTSFNDKDSLMCKMYVTAGSCNTVDSLVWGPIQLVRNTKPATPTISLIGTLLVSSIPTGIQWYGPSGLIPGATGPTYHPTTEGSYYAVVVNGGCSSDHSNSLNVSLLGISPYNMNEVRIYPNPTSNVLTLDWGSEKISGNLDIFTATGQRVLTSVLDNETKHTVNMSQYANGHYFVVIRDNKGKTGTVSITVAH